MPGICLAGAWQIPPQRRAAGQNGSELPNHPAKEMPPCRVLSEWSKLEGKPLSDLSPELYAETAGIHKAEVNEKTKEFMQKLLDGETGDDQ